MSTLVLVTVIEDATEQYKTKYKNNYKEGDNYLLKRLKMLNLSTLLPGENLEKNLKCLFTAAAEKRDKESKTWKTLLDWANQNNDSVIKAVLDTPHSEKYFGKPLSSSWTLSLHRRLKLALRTAQMNDATHQLVTELIKILYKTDEECANYDWVVREWTPISEDIVELLFGTHSECGSYKCVTENQDFTKPLTVIGILNDLNNKIERFNRKYKPADKLLCIKIPTELQKKRKQPKIDSQSRIKICSELGDELKKL